MAEPSETAKRLVWSRARGLCSKCRHDLVEKIGGDPKSIGKVAHITARNPSGARYDESLDDVSRNGYSNLVLLCGTCHDEVDAAPSHYTVAKLQSIKAEHEAYCSELLTVDDVSRNVVGEILANAVDLIVDGASLGRWDDWTAELLGPSPYRWPSWAMKDFRLDLRARVYAVLWPKSARSLEVSSKLLVRALLGLYSTFCARSAVVPGPDGSSDAGFFECVSRARALEDYHFARGTKEWYEYARYLDLWDLTLELALVHFARCANLFAEAVREHVNPRFRITIGNFIIEPCSFSGTEYGVCTFSAEEKKRIFREGDVEYDDESPWEAVRQSWIEPPLREKFE